MSKNKKRIRTTRKQSKKQQNDKGLINTLVLIPERMTATGQDAEHNFYLFFSMLPPSSVIGPNTDKTSSEHRSDEKSLEELNLIVKMSYITHMIEDKEKMIEEDCVVFMPSFVQVLRDFSLNLIDDENKTIKFDEYLEKALKER